MSLLRRCIKRGRRYIKRSTRAFLAGLVAVMLAAGTAVMLHQDGLLRILALPCLVLTISCLGWAVKHRVLPRALQGMATGFGLASGLVWLTPTPTPEAASTVLLILGGFFFGLSIYFRKLRRREHRTAA